MADLNRELQHEQQNNNERPARQKSGTSNRGFASMSAAKQKEIASKGGRAAHEQGVAHQWSSDEARTAGRKGGQTVSQNRQHMAEIGRKGGQASRGGGRSKSHETDDMQDNMDIASDYKTNDTGYNDRRRNSDSDMDIN